MSDCDPAILNGIRRIEAKLADMEIKLAEIENAIADVYTEVSE